MKKNECHDNQAEVNILRIALLDSGDAGVIASELEEEDFFSSAHRKIFKCISEMFDRGEKVTLPEVCIRTGESQKITEGWVHAEYTSSAHLSTYISRVKELAAMRKLYAAMGDSPNIKEIISLVSGLAEKIEARKISSFTDTVKLYEKHISEKKERLKAGRGIGLITGYKIFDEQICLEPTHLVCLAAKSSIGKSAFALNLAVNCAMFEQNVIYFSAEMREESLMDRVCALLTDAPINRFKFCQADSSYKMAKHNFTTLEKHLKIRYSPRCTSDEVYALSKKEAAKEKVDLIVVDYLQYLSDPVQKGGNNNERIGKITRNLKQLAGDLGCCVLMLSQVNRKAEGMPELEHLRDSGNIEQDSDLVLMLHREDRNDVCAQLAVKKAREGEAERVIKFRFAPTTTKFNEM